MRLFHKKKFKNRDRRKPYPPAPKKKQATEDTLPELLTQKILTELNIKFCKQYDLSGFIYDLMIPDKKIIIEVDGDYFHANPLVYPYQKMTKKQRSQQVRDTLKNKIAIDNGFSIIRVWEKDLNENYDMVKSEFKYILHHIQPIYVIFENKCEKYKRRVIRLRNSYKNKSILKDKIINELTNMD